uniref:tRNA wybutosine-synthesizing protein 4 n=1 Tax=Nothobranchius kuhntae TaxID=321403 RepID=A0A1A8IU58_NOTKU
MPRTKKKQQHKKGSDTAVQGTNDSSVVSKASAAARGYFRDAFLQHFVCRVARRAPLINRGYYVRWRAVDHCVRRFLQVTAGCPKRQILSLGAGFDSLYFRLRADGDLDRAVVYEVDFADVAQRKAALIAANETLGGMLDSCLPSSPGPVYVSSSMYQLLGVDIREEAQVEDALSAAGLHWAAPTLVLSEVVLTYMETDRSDATISWAAKLLPQSVFVMYEQICPHDPFGRIMQEHFLKLNSTLHALRQYPDTRAQRRRFLTKGWDCLSSAPVISWSPTVLPVRPIPVSLEGLGMASTRLGPEQVMLTGGSSKGGRLAETRALLRGQEGWRAVVEPFVDLGVRLHHTVTCVPGGGVVIYGGRSSPLNPIRDIFRVTFNPCGVSPAADPQSQAAETIHVESMICSGDPPPPRWRHTASVVSLRGRDFLFVFGGKNQSESALGDGHFLNLGQQIWTEMPVEGTAPPARHSHSACPYQSHSPTTRCC